MFDGTKVIKSSCKDHIRFRSYGDLFMQNNITLLDSWVKLYGNLQPLINEYNYQDIRLL